MQHIFGNPGSTELAFLRDFPPDFQYVLALQESVAVGMADGFAQATRRAALVNLHSAVGVGHAMGNIFTAYRNRTPLVITAGQQARSLLQLDPFLFSERPTELPQPYVKWSVEPARAADVPRAIQRAWHIAMQPPCGPVFVSIPSDDWDQPAEEVAPHTVVAAQRADAAALAKLGQQLAASQRPVFVVGSGIDRDLAWTELVKLAELHGALVWVSPLIGRASFPEDHPLFAGFLPAFREEIHKRLAGHDLLMAIGAPLFTYHAPGTGPYLPTGLAAHQLTDDPGMAAASLAGDSIVGSIRESLRELLAAGRRDAAAKQAGRVRVPRLPMADPLSDRLLLQTLADLRTPDSIIVEEAPSSREPMHDYLPILAPETFYTCSSGGLGFSLPAAVGVALARPKSKVITLLGDGSAMYSIQGLWSAAQQRLPIVFIVINNGRYEALRQIGVRLGNARPVGMELPGLDFVELARAQGCEGMRVTAAAELEPTLRAALSAQGPVLVDVHVG
jgi:benzoylformate decarboxylase